MDHIEEIQLAVEEEIKGIRPVMGIVEVPAPRENTCVGCCFFENSGLCSLIFKFDLLPFCSDGTVLAIADISGYKEGSSE